MVLLPLMPRASLDAAHSSPLSPPRPQHWSSSQSQPLKNPIHCKELQSKILTVKVIPAKAEERGLRMYLLRVFLRLLPARKIEPLQD